MIPNAYEPLNPVVYPIDQTVISTTFRIRKELGECPPDKLSKLPDEIRYLVHSISSYASDGEPGSRKVGKPANKRYDPSLARRTILIDGLEALRLHAFEDSALGWVVHKMDFNPGHLVNGHNGRILTEESFLHSLSVLIHLVTPLLAEESEWTKIVPGLSPHSAAFWKSIELPFQIIDTRGDILLGFRHAKHAEIDLLPLDGRRGESMTFENADGSLLIRTYRKDLQMLKKHGRKLTHYVPVLRIETKLSKDKLSGHFTGGAWQTIQGKCCLTSFRPNDVREAFLSVVRGFQGVYTHYLPGSALSKHDRMGSLIGWVMFRTGMTFDEIFSFIQQRFLSGNMPRSISSAKSSLHVAARAEVARLGTRRFADLFGDEALSAQPHVIVEKLEAMTHARHHDVRIHPAVVAAYGSLPTV